MQAYLKKQINLEKKTGAFVISIDVISIISTIVISVMRIRLSNANPISRQNVMKFIIIVNQSKTINVIALDPLGLSGFSDHLELLGNAGSFVVYQPAQPEPPV